MTPTFDDIETLARTIWGEARGEGVIGMRLVAEVIANRVVDPRWPNSFAKVCTQRKQFSCWNADDVNSTKLLAVDLADPEFAEAATIAAEAVCKSAAFSDNVAGATHYLTTSLFNSSKRPSWADPAKVVATIGNHVFLKL